MACAMWGRCLMRIIVLLFLELCPLTGSLAWCTPLPPGHAASRPLADSIVGSAAEGCLGLHLRLFLPPLRGGGRPEGRPDVEEILKRSLERTDHVALWESDELGGEHYDDISEFRVLNPDPTAPWPPPNSDGAKFGRGELLNDYMIWEEDGEDLEKEMIESRQQRADKRSQAKMLEEMEYFSVESIQGYTDKEDWIRDNLKGEDLELWREFEAFFTTIYPNRDPETASKRDIDFFLSTSKEKKRKDDFFFLPIEQSQAIQAELDEFNKTYPDANLINQSPIPRLVTWWHTLWSSYGYCFDLRARDSDIVIRAIHACSYTTKGPFNYTIWSTTGTWRYKCHSEKLWTRIGQGTVKLEMDEGNYTRLPLTESVKIRAGSTQAFYIHTPDNDSGVGYRNRPCKALDDGQNFSGLKIIEDKGVAIDGVLYSNDEAVSGDITERNEDLFVLTGAVSHDEVPFENVAEISEFQTSFCGMIDYELVK